MSASDLISKIQPTSLGGLLRISCKTYAPKTALIIPTKDGLEKLTYEQLWTSVRRWASGLRSLGLRRGDAVCIISENSAEWAFFDWASQVLGIVVVPIFPSLPADQALYILKDCGAILVACGDAHQLEKIGSNEGVRSFLLGGSDNSIAKIASEAALISEDEFESEIDRTNPEDVATIIYTSGTTGLPKGVMLQHKSFIWMNRAVAGQIPLTHQDTFFCFLPLSHVFGRANDHYLPISLGATIGYCRSLASISSDMAKVQPTVMLVVPRLLQAFKEKIIDGAGKQSPLRQKLFSSLISEGKKKSHGKFSLTFPMLDKIVGSKIREKVGPRLRFFVSGGAALPRDLYDFYFAIGIPIQQGYGLTETSSAITVNNPAHENRPETVGEPLDKVEVKIAEDGEILVRGDFVMKGYHGLPDETAAVINAEGWFYTGDIGEMSNGYLKITDRKKDLLVLGNGKNVAPQPIENKLRESSLIEEAVLFGDGLDGCVALIVPNFELVRTQLNSTQSDEELAASPEAKKLIKAEVDKVNKALAQFEAVKKFALLPAKFTVEGGELTPTLKVKRKGVRVKYGPVLDSLIGGESGRAKGL